MKCKCGAYMNPSWKVCLVCGSHKHPGEGISSGDFEWVAIRSTILGGEVILIAPDDIEVKGTGDRIVYRASEIKHLEALSANEIKKVHYAKKLFGGQIRNFINKKE